MRERSKYFQYKSFIHEDGIDKHSTLYVDLLKRKTCRANVTRSALLTQELWLRRLRGNFQTFFGIPSKSHYVQCSPHSNSVNLWGLKNSSDIQLIFPLSKSSEYYFSKSSSIRIYIASYEKPW